MRLRGGRRSRNGARGKRKGGAPLSSSAVLERATAGGAPGSSAEATAAAARRSGGGRPDARTAPPLSSPPPRRRRAASGCTPSPRPGSPAAPGRRRRAHRRGADIESALAEARLFKTAIARWFARVLALPQARSTVRLSTPWTPARARCRVFFAWQVGPSLPALALNNPRCPRRRSPWADRRTRHTCAHPLDTSRGPQVANRGARAPKTATFRRIGRSGALGQPGSSPGGAAARRAATPSRARMYATVPWAGRRSSTRPRAGGPARASFRLRAETADAAPSGPGACAGRRRARVPRRGRGGAPRTARGLRRRPERRPGAGGRRPRTRLRGPAAGDRAGPGSGPARAGSAPATCTTSVGAAEPIADAALALRRGALADPRKRHEVVPPRDF